MLAGKIMTEKIKVLWRIGGWKNPIKVTFLMYFKTTVKKALRATTYCGKIKLSINTNSMDLKSGVKT